MNRPPTTSGIDASAPSCEAARAPASATPSARSRNSRASAARWSACRPIRLENRNVTAARHSNDLELVLEQGQQLEQREEHAGRYSDRNQRGNAGWRGLIDVEPPAVCRKRLQFDDQAGQQRRSAPSKPTGPGYRAGLDHLVDVEGAGDVIEQHRAEQEERRGHHRRQMYLKAAASAAGVSVEAE